MAPSRVRSARRGPAFWYTQDGQLVGLSVLTVAMALLGTFNSQLMPVSAFSVVITLGAFFLQLRRLLVLYLLITACVVFVYVNRVFAPTPGHFFVIGLTATLALAFAISRRDLGLQGRASDTMLLDLRDRLMAQGKIPELPAGWAVEAHFSPASWQRFSGDFLVAVAGDDNHLELCLVDVSGKGPAAATRSLSLSGAYGGLLGPLSPSGYLQAANEYLLRQEWDEGFATAVYVDIDLDTGSFMARYAGHPPAAHYHGASYTWDVLEGASGPALGIIEAAEYPAVYGRLAHGDALLLFTDGVVEEPGLDLAEGMERLMTTAGPELAGGGVDVASRIMTRIGAAEDDDRSMVLIRRLETSEEK